MTSTELKRTLSARPGRTLNACTFNVYGPDDMIEDGMVVYVIYHPSTGLHPISGCSVTKDAAALRQIAPENVGRGVVLKTFTEKPHHVQGWADVHLADEFGTLTDLL